MSNVPSADGLHRKKNGGKEQLTLTLRQTLGYAHLPHSPMHSYTVQELADIAGVSVRTLHHYDEIDLLNPSREANGYRSYREEDLLRLQQILFYKELDVPLEEIKAMLDDPAFDTRQALRAHRGNIAEKKKRLTGLIRTIDATLKKLSGEKDMSDDQLFEAFWEKHEKDYAPEAEERWGGTEAYRQSKERTKHLTKEDYKRMAKDGDKFMRELVRCMKHGPTHPKTQEMIAKHYESLRAFYDPSPALYRNLGRMYVDDPRFRAFYERCDRNMPAFMRDAMARYADTLEERKD